MGLQQGHQGQASFPGRLQGQSMDCAAAPAPAAAGQRNKRGTGHRYFRNSQNTTVSATLTTMQLVRGKKKRTLSRAMQMSPGSRPNGRVRSQGQSTPTAMQPTPRRIKVLFTALSSLCHDNSSRSATHDPLHAPSCAQALLQALAGQTITTVDKIKPHKKSPRAKPFIFSAFTLYSDSIFL